MSTITHPPKDLVRAYLAQRLRERQPPPAPEEIRRRLGWVILLPELRFATTSGRVSGSYHFSNPGEIR